MAGGNRELEHLIFEDDILVANTVLRRQGFGSRCRSTLHQDCFHKQTWDLVLILYGNSEIGAHVGRNILYLICLRHLIFSFMSAQHFKLPSNISTMDPSFSVCLTFQVSISKEGDPYFKYEYSSRQGTFIRW